MPVGRYSMRDLLLDLQWIETTRGMTRGRVLRKRRKMDKFIWRVHNRLVPSLEAKVRLALGCPPCLPYVIIHSHRPTHDDDDDDNRTSTKSRSTSGCLSSTFSTVTLASWSRRSPTSAWRHCFVSRYARQLLMPTLTHSHSPLGFVIHTPQEWVVTRGKLSVESGAYVQLFHEILELFDELVMQNRDPSLDEFLLFVLVENLEVRYGCHLNARLRDCETQLTYDGMVAGGWRLVHSVLGVHQAIRRTVAAQEQA